MKTRSLVVLGAVAALAVAAVVVFLRQPPHVDPGAVTTAPTARTQPESAPISAASTSKPTIPPAPTKPLAKTPFLDGIHTFKDLNDRAKASDPQDVDALKSKADALVLCQSGEAEMDQRFAIQQKRNGVSKDAQASFDALKAYKRRFCVGTEGESAGAALSSMLTADPSSDYLLSTTLTDDEDKERAVAMALKIVRTSDSPAAINNAAMFLASAGDDAWTDGKDAVEGSYLSQHLPEIQTLAAAMVACDVGGGCGPDGLYSWSICQQHDICHPGVSMDEIWRKTNAPDVYDAARKVAGSMRKSH